MRALLLAFFAVAKIKVGDKLPTAMLHQGFPPEHVDITERVMGKKVVLVGLPGAFTPT
jgi:2-Cys peroxiredoxin 5